MVLGLPEAALGTLYHVLYPGYFIESTAIAAVFKVYEID